MAEPGPPRSYRAPCPGCGAPVEFRSAQSSFAVCGYCQSTVVRQGDTLARTGQMAELFDDFSPLQLFATGRLDGQPFTLIGRLQYSYPGGRWTEWIAALEAGPDDPAAASLDGSPRLGVLSEDNGAFVFSRPLAALQVPAPPAAELRVGATTAVNGQSYTVASNEQAALLSAQGELPHLPALGRPFAVVELRSAQGQVLSLDYDTQPPSAWLGHTVRLDELQLSGLREGSVKEELGRSFNCPNCGAPITVRLADSQSTSCGACHSLIDLNTGIGGELRHAEQSEPVRPLIPLGRVGQLQGAAWQVVGFQHRMGVEPGDDEAFGWDEYLLYHPKRGFCFLVDASDGWSLVKPTTGAPTLATGGRGASYLGQNYTLQSSYEAETTYAAGEFYWTVERGQKTSNRDFAAGPALLSSERSARELTWSSGRRIDSAAVVAAFKLEDQQAKFKRDDALPVSGAFTGSGMGCSSVIVLIVVLVIVLLLLSTCSGPSGGSSGRSSGGSYGGYSSGGGHK